MKLTRSVLLVLMYWILFLDTSPDRHGFYDWAGQFNAKEQCEETLAQEKNHPYNANPGAANPFWVQGRSGFCRSSDEVFPRAKSR